MVALEFIKRVIPDAKIDWIVESGFKGILESNPNIDNILSVNLKSIKKNKSQFFSQYSLLKSYSKNKYDLVIDAQGLLKSAIVSKIIGGKRVAGFDKDSIRESVATFFYDDMVNIKYEANAIDRNMAVICEPLNITYSKDEILKKEKFLFFKEPDSVEEEPYLLLVVGASRENKIYPKEKFLEVIDILQERVVIVWGNDEEFEIATWIAQNSSYAEIALKGNLDVLKSMINGAKAVIGGDTGPTHIAWALNIPSVTIFGNTPEYRNTYITDINRVVKSTSTVDPLKLDYSDFSIREIKAQEIVDVYRSVINKT